MTLQVKGDYKKSFYAMIINDPYKNTPTTPNPANRLLNICNNAYTPIDTPRRIGNASMKLDAKSVITFSVSHSNPYSAGDFKPNIYNTPFV